MALHDSSQFLMTVVLTILIGALFLHAWTHARGMPALALWGTGYLVGGLGSLLLALRFHIPDVLSVGLGNTVVLAGYGLCWSGCRSFEGRAPRHGFAFLGSLAWGLACLVPGTQDSIAIWHPLLSFLLGGYVALYALELWRGRSEALPSLRLLILLQLIHAASAWLSIPLLVVMPLPEGPAVLDSPRFALTGFMATVFPVSSAILMMAMARERSERNQRLAAETDALTGLPNRRAFVARAAQECAVAERPLALLLLDLDHFKAINDTHGHAVGDEVLVTFSRVMQAVLPREATFGRLGGEEFACLIEGSRLDEAVRVAEQLRERTASIVLPRHHGLAIRVSIGIALKPKDRADGVDALIRRADEALYRAKHAGRNRVEFDRDPVLDRAA